MLHVGISAWIIQDGNYSDFERGSIRRFALEFHAENSLVVVSDGRQAPGLIHHRESEYSAGGIVRFCTDKVWVIDFGSVMAYRKERPPSGVVPGSFVTGEISLGIDPFFYYEGLYGIPGMPALIYEWEIAGITMETAPIIESFKHPQVKCLARDLTKRGQKPIHKTNAWNDDNGFGDYVLECRLVSTEAFWNLGSTTDDQLDGT
jgi:hypothetical protein